MSSRSCDPCSHKRFVRYRTFSIYPLYRCSWTHSHLKVQQISSEFWGISWRNDDRRGACPWNHTWHTQVCKNFWNGECIEVLWKMAKTNWWFAKILIKKKCRVCLDNDKKLHILSVILQMKCITKIWFTENYFFVHQEVFQECPYMNMNVRNVAE